MNQALNIAIVVIVFIALCVGVVSLILNFSMRCKCGSKLGGGNYTMPDCASASIWGKCIQGSSNDKCIPIYEGKMPPNNKLEGCWVRKDKPDVCNVFIEGGPSPNMSPKSCASVCCNGGYVAKKE